MVGLLALSYWISRRGRVWAGLLLVASLLTGLAAQLFWTRPELLVQVLPATNALFFGNWFPFAVALAAPPLVRFAKTKGQRIRVALLCCVLLGASLVGTARLFGDPADVGPEEFFSDGATRQTSADTCSAAASATLLRAHGIETTENEMARLAFSKRNRGTHPLGLYRALKIAVHESTSSARVRYRSMTAEEVLSRNQPAIVNVGLLQSAQNAMEVDLIARNRKPMTYAGDPTSSITGNVPAREL
jgi:hypothetical protein